MKVHIKKALKSMRNILLNQLKERNRLLSIPYIQREMSLDIPALLHSKQIKLITGPRRSGKSTQALLMLKDTNFAYLNFDDNALLSHWNEDLVMETLASVYPQYDYLMLDEVQNLDNWDLWVSKLYRNGVNLVITGSNAKLLSSEMATALTGRYLQVEMYPFSLHEALRITATDAAPDAPTTLAAIDDYLHNGGYPETFQSRPLTQSYLSTLFDSIVLKDVAKRHKVRHIEDLNNTAMYLLSNYCNPLSANDITNALALSSTATTQKYMAYLTEPYLFFYLSRYNNKLKLMKRAPRKVYVIDNGFVTAKAFNLSENLGRLLENQVFVELLRRGYNTERSLFYYRTRNDKEIDFVTRRGTQIESLIQVCYDLGNEKALRRELSALVEASQELHCDNLTIITYNTTLTITHKEHQINVMPIAQM